MRKCVKMENIDYILEYIESIFNYLIKTMNFYYIIPSL